MTSIVSSNSNLHSDDISDKFQHFVQSKSIADVIRKVKPVYRQLLDLPLTSTMEDAFDLLLAEDIISVPIYYTEDHEKKYVAIVSALDLLKLLSTKVSLDTLQNNSNALLMPLREAINHTEHLTILNSTDSLKELLELFSVHRMHRVLIRQQSELVLISQMDLIRFFQAFNHQIGSVLLDLPINELHASAIKAKLNYKCTAAEAFLKLAADDMVTSLPVVDDSDDLIGEISAQDLRGLNRTRWDTLLKPVVMFLKTSHGDLTPPLTCHDRFTLSQVMTSFVLRNTRRLWWVDYETNELKAVITLTDLLTTFFSYC